ncbi:MAG: hypothetical protein ACLQGP_36510 [Isosphaeraceae bacterium]
MSHDTKSSSLDLVRWAFTIDADHRAEIEGHLADLGADVLVRDGTEFLVTWDEPEEDLSEVIEAIWALNGEPFDVVQEEFQRLSLHTLQHCDDEPVQEAA